jgi:hypothetical protein
MQSGVGVVPLQMPQQGLASLLLVCTPVADGRWGKMYGRGAMGAINGRQWRKGGQDSGTIMMCSVTIAMDSGGSGSCSGGNGRRWCNWRWDGNAKVLRY